MAKQDLLLNHIFLKNRIAELGIKQWWLAEQVGVDRKTVVRWVQGQVRSIQPENAEKLAKILSCAVSELTAASGADQMATAEDQKTAASLLVKSSLIEKLGPMGEWDVIESLLKATIVPNLPLNVLGEVYNQLTIASWRQSKIEAASQYNVKAEEIARKTGDQELLASALISKANIHSWRGETGRSIATYQECMQLEKYIEPRALGAATSNFGAVLYESGNLDEGERLIRKSLEVFHNSGKPTNLSIASCHLAMILLQKNRMEEAEQAANASIYQAELDDYRRGQQMGKLILAEIEARRSHAERARALVQSAFEGFAELGIREGLNYEFAGRVERLLGNFTRAIELLREGIALAKDFPIYRAALHVELARSLKLNGEDANPSAREAIRIYTETECPLRVAMVQKEFQIN